MKWRGKRLLNITLITGLRYESRPLVTLDG